MLKIYFLGPLVSTFQMDRGGTSFAWEKSQKEVVPTIAVSFNVVTCTIDPVTSKPTLIETEYPIAGDIAQQAMVIGGADKGRSKKFTRYQSVSISFIASDSVFSTKVLDERSARPKICRKIVYPCCHKGPKQ